MDKLTELLDEFGYSTWRPEHPEKQSQLFRWMTEVTNRIFEIEHKLSEKANKEKNLP